MNYETISASVQKIITFRLDFGIAGEYSYTGCEYRNAGCENQFYSSRQYQVHRYIKTSLKCSLKKTPLPYVQCRLLWFHSFFLHHFLQFFHSTFLWSHNVGNKDRVSSITMLPYYIMNWNKPVSAMGRQVFGAGYLWNTVRKIDQCVYQLWQYTVYWWELEVIVLWPGLNSP